MKEPKVIEIFADNGEHSHWQLIDENGEILWSEESTEVKNNAVLPHVSAMLPDLDIDKAEELAWETDYACFAVEEDGNEINKADAGAFFLEGYNYAKGNLR